MINEQEFTDLRKRYEDDDEAREAIIKRSRDALKASKQAIYALQRSDVKQAEELLKKADSIFEELLPLAEGRLRHQGALSNALEEYVEAKAFMHFLKEGSLISMNDLPPVSVEEFLGGVSDLTGEMMRYAVNKGTAKDKETVQKIRDLIDSVYGQLSQFAFRNSDLRRKYDSIKYNLQKVERVLYELSLVR
ncbi:hypothetical protein GOV11_01425 [Candidatus Woesearchaeota archaeon]|nr:hypothetical protein [Candidatus Woesearchaeota archaeon]